MLLELDLHPKASRLAYAIHRAYAYKLGKHFIHWPESHWESLESWTMFTALNYKNARDLSNEYEEGFETWKAYRAFEMELERQYLFLLQMGIGFEFTEDDPVDPETGKLSYAYVKRLFESDPSKLPVFTGGEAHPILGEQSSFDVSYNNIFRAVHDVLGHLASGGTFSQRGEIRAYYSHLQLFSPLAQKALFTETMGQVCFWKYYGEFAPQKCFLFRPEYMSPPRS